ncbi:hypothetical protein BZA77DRAFT_344822 [Pyronema omphalodes]|nr:hypothetical protein BZA77DRAFT_344822 [Pyronema omphalodes]
MKFTLLTISTLFTLTLAAYRQPTTKLVDRGAIRLPDYEHPVTSGQYFEIVWDARFRNIATRIPADHNINSDGKGTFRWRVPRRLKIIDGKKNYAIQLIVDQTGEYQYSTEFEILRGPRGGWEEKIQF